MKECNELPREIYELSNEKKMSELNERNGEHLSEIERRKWQKNHAVNYSVEHVAHSEKLFYYIFLPFLFSHSLAVLTHFYTS